MANPAITNDFIAALPKTDLQVHLDGSPRIPTLIELARAYRLDLPSHTEGGLRETVHGVPSQLTPREAKVLRMRFGIDLTTDDTLEEVGKQFDVTRERIRQIEAKALRKLRHSSRSEQLRSFLVEDQVPES